MFPEYTSAERTADILIHVLTVGSAIGAVGALTAIATDLGGPARIALAAYGIGLLAMSGLSAAYSLVAGDRRKDILRRLDHSAIFIMIAGTCTPFAVVTVGGMFGCALLIFEWAIAAGGIAMKLLLPRRFERTSIIAYLLQGWVFLVAIGPLVATLSKPTLVLLAAGGLLYSIGVGFHLWDRLRYQNAIWHLCVLLAAGCHFFAVLRAVAPQAAES